MRVLQIQTAEFLCFLVMLSERVPEALSTRVQGCRCEEVTFHPSALQYLQGLVGLAHPAGNLLCCRHCTL